MDRAGNKYIRAVVSILMGMMLFLPLAQAEPAADAQPFDHAKTGFLLRDVHTTLRCEQCHVDGIFKNTPKDCAGCHSIGSRVGASPKPVNHVQTTLPCDTCHTSPTSFLVKNFKHPGITSGCSTCHNSQSSGVMSRPANHFPTALPCESCHTNTNTFTSWRMDHTGIFSNCGSCHGAASPYAGIVKVPPMPTQHIQTTADCGTCHNTSSFLGARFSHAAVAAGSCDSCHMGQQPGVVAKPAVHIPTLGATCDGCHTTAVSTMSFLGARFNHTGVAVGSCDSCHMGQYPGVMAKPAIHIPTLGAKCDGCHTTAATTKSFLGVTFHTTGLVPTNICSNCHSGQFAAARAKPATHVMTSAQCDTCHVNTANYTTWLGATFTHANPPGVCATCHNGVTARGKPVYHVPTTLACDNGACHTQTNTLNYTTFLGVIYTHPAPITQRCDTCHNGTTAKGKMASHVVTSADCGVCHVNTANYTTFLGAVYTHPTPVTQRCDSCHNGTIAKGKMPSHIVTSADCGVCHVNTANYTTFLGATYVHSPVPAAGSCGTCHNNVTALGKPAWHMVTTGTCDSCHPGALAAMSFVGGQGAPNHAGFAVTSCATGACHNGTNAKGMSPGHIPTGTISCGYCHAPFGGAVTTFNPGTMGSTGHAAVTSIRCYSCHNGAYTSQGLNQGGALAMPGNHIPLTITGGVGGLECTTCHISPGYNTAGAAGWLPEKMNHNGASGMGAPIYCVTCHLSGTAYLAPGIIKKSHNGSSTAKDCSSASCHKPLGRFGIPYSKWN